MFTMYSAPKSVLLCESDYVVILQALLAAGADVNALNKVRIATPYALRARTYSKF